MQQDFFGYRTQPTPKAALTCNGSNLSCLVHRVPRLS
jgi:hypothetical protein